MPNPDDLHPYSTLTPDVILDAVESAKFQCNGRLLALNSYENRVYQIGLEESDPIVVKFYRPQRWSNEAIHEEHEFTLKLAEQEIPVVPPLVSESESESGNGITLHTHQQFRFSLYARRGGHGPDLSQAEHRQWLGRFVGRIHAFGELKSYKHRPSLTVDSFVTQPSQFLLEQQILPPHIEQIYADLIEQATGLINERYRMAGETSSIRLHGDCHAGNVLWTDQGPHFVDFDDSRMGPAIQDLWMMLSGQREEMTSQLVDLLEGYQRFFNFNESELHLIEALRTMRIVNYAAWLAKRWSDPAFPAAFPWFDSPRFWEDHILSLREQIALLQENTIVLY
ncbi:YihE protein, required for LPS synthesis [hydrothermal vent metagenome]|uniref:YihE protein, required for LPS synthesis n=1 Tax=hydrothermal vent metagenome TaxID=652676 RepID=A0A3B0Y9Z1_9ZZZZ